MQKTAYISSAGQQTAQKVTDRYKISLTAKKKKQSKLDRALDLVQDLADYTDDRLKHPECIFCGADMQDGLNNYPDDPNGHSDGPDPSHLEFCPVVKARRMIMELRNPFPPQRTISRKKE